MLHLLLSPDRARAKRRFTPFQEGLLAATLVACVALGGAIHAAWAPSPVASAAAATLQAPPAASLAATATDQSTATDLTAATVDSATDAVAVAADAAAEPVPAAADAAAAGGSAPALAPATPDATADAAVAPAPEPSAAAEPALAPADGAAPVLAAADDAAPAMSELPMASADAAAAGDTLAAASAAAAPADASTPPADASAAATAASPAAADDAAADQPRLAALPDAAAALAAVAPAMDAPAVIASAPADEPSAAANPVDGPPAAAEAPPPDSPPAALAAVDARPLVDQITRYRVAPGDGLEAIAQRFGISVDTLRWANTLPADPNLLYVGQELIVLPVDGLLDTARPDDTLQSVAARDGGTVASLAQANGLAESDSVSAGQLLLVPGGRPGAALASGPADWPAPAADAGYRQRFIAAAVGPAQDSERQTGVPASVTIAQAIEESDWGVSKLAREANNYFGIKAVGTPSASDVYWIETWEVVDGEDVLELDPFQAYKTPQDSFADHGQFFLRNSRYAAARQVASDPRAFAQAIADAGYATDPAYAAKLIRLMDQYDLYQYDLFASAKDSAATVKPPAPAKAPAAAPKASPDVPQPVDGPVDCHCWIVRVPSTAAAAAASPADAAGQDQ